MGKTFMRGGPHGPTGGIAGRCRETTREIGARTGGTHATAANQHATTRRRLSATLSAALAALVALCLVVGAALPASAASSFERINIVYVPESEIEDAAYSWSIDFEGWDLDAAVGFERSDDIGQYRKDLAGEGAGDTELRNTPGWVARIDGSTPADTVFSLRATGGHYGSQEIDAIITLTGWTYLEPADGWTGSETYQSETRYYPTFQTGVFIADEDRTVADDDEGIQSLSFYTVGLTEIEVEIQFVEAGTNTPVEMRGHLTTTDLDVWQSFSFGGSVIEGRLSEKNDVLYLSDDGTTVESGLVWLDPTDPDDYRNGMVEAYFDTTGENRGVPLKFYFGTSWGIDEQGRTSESVFYLNTEYLTLPASTTEDGTEATKSADKTGEDLITVGDEVAYEIAYTVHEQGANCRWGYRYTSLEIVDELPAEMSYVEGSGRLLDASDADVTEAAGEVVCEDGTVRFVFDEAFLQEEMAMEGEQYVFSFSARLDAYPESGESFVTNGGYVLINGTDVNRTNDVVTNLTAPSVTVEKTVGAFEGYVGTVSDEEDGAADGYDGTFEYVVRVANEQTGTVAKNVAVTDDSLPVGMALATDADGNPAITLRENGEDVAMAWSDGSATGVLAAVGDDAAAPAWTLERSGDGWTLSIDRLSSESVVEVVYHVAADESVSGWEIENVASVTADDCTTVEDEAVTWVNQPHLVVEKTASEETLAKGDEVTYRVRVTNTTAGTLARSVTISDLADVEGVELLSDTIRVYDSAGEDVTEGCEITYDEDGVGFAVQTGRDLVSGTGERPVWAEGALASTEGENPLGVEPGSPREESEGCETELVVEYQLRVTDAALAGATLTNVAAAEAEEPNTWATDENTLIVTDRPGVTTLEKTASVAEASVGDEISYTVTAVAGGDLTEVVVSDAGLPDCVQIDPESIVVTVNGVEVAAEPTSDGTGFSLSVGNVSTADVIRVSYTATVLDAEDLPESATNVAALASPDLDEPVSDDAVVDLVAEPAEEPVDEPEKPDEPEEPDEPLEVEEPTTLTKEALADEVGVGETVSYVVTAVAGRDLTEVVLRDSGLPEGAEIDLASVVARVNGETGEDLVAGLDGTGLALGVGGLAAGDVLTLEYDVAVTDEALAGETLVNTATLEAAELDEPLEATVEVRVGDAEDEEVAEVAGVTTTDGGSSSGGSSSGGTTEGSKLPSTGESSPAVPLAVAGVGATVVAVALKARRLIA